MKKFVASMVFTSALAASALSGVASAQQAPAAAAPVTAPASELPPTVYIGGAVMLFGLAGFFAYRSKRRSDAAARPAPAPVSAKPAIPPGVDTGALLRQAKATFIRMQKTWDKADANDLRQFTTPQVYAELQPQMQAPGASVTDVVAIESELLGVETVGDSYLATVRFSGQIRTAPGAAPEALAEVWNMSKPVKGGGDWKLAGIGQLS
ncbi:Tim44 domain-containing protein [Massilia violaceinigra]|uniref:Tim44 domain-containing protein n=1 Tax=Massilia violaceinigra TaxID=2045208 RepID=A0ABY4AGS1_9BURK|nr:Tim44-like domain-containing protein [Massilia violaceinigra]UOD32756.1 Tim44 domain-containing protein [Massilia violaceinigra]